MNNHYIAKFLKQTIIQDNDNNLNIIPINNGLTNIAYTTAEKKENINLYMEIMT